MTLAIRVKMLRYERNTVVNVKFQNFIETVTGLKRRRQFWFIHLKESPDVSRGTILKMNVRSFRIGIANVTF